MKNNTVLFFFFVKYDQKKVQKYIGVQLCTHSPSQIVIDITKGILLTITEAVSQIKFISVIN
jgi:hypothetical protein